MGRYNTVRPYLSALDAMRITACLWILLFHLWPQIQLFFGKLGFIGALIKHGYYGVDLFFCLSGFVIYYHYADRLLPWRWPVYCEYLLARLRHIYPLHLAILLALVVFIFAGPYLHITINNPQDYTWPSFFEQIFLVSAWSFPTVMTWNYYAWAISALWLMYLLAPLFVLVIDKLRKPFLLFLFALALSLLTPLVVWLFQFDSKVAYGMVRAFSAFGLGMIACWFSIIYPLPKRKRDYLRLLPFFIILKIIGIVLQIKSPQHTDFLNTPYFAILLYFLARQKFPDWSITRYSASISYALYMIQYPVLMLVKKLYPANQFLAKNDMTQIEYIFVQIVLCVVVAILSHHAIERPIQNFLSKFDKSRSAV